MRNSALVLLLVPMTLGCGATRLGSEYEDKVAVREQFIAVVKECYRERGDGILREPTVDPDRVRLVFQFHKELDGAESECVELTFSKQVDAHGHSRRVYRVLAYQPVPGPNRVLDEQTRRIAAMLQERLKTSPK